MAGLGAECGQMLSHYRLVEKIGEGGMGVVWKALDENLRRFVAVKVLPPDSLADLDLKRRFLREARSAAAVTHPYIAAIHNTGEADGTSFIVMEYVEGRTLRSLLEGGPLPIRESLRIGAEIAEGLARAHEASIVHRDLKPANVMVRPDGHVKILDFGLAKLVEKRDEAPGSNMTRQETASLDLTRRGEILGTAAYMSPEQARGQTVDHRSDLFSFGSMLYEMVTGGAPFRGPTALDTLSAILHLQPKPASHLNAEVPAELERIVGKCLEKSPEARYQHTHELVLDLERVRRETESQSRAAPPPIKKRRRRDLIVAVSALAAAAALYLAWQRPWRPHAVTEAAASAPRSELASIAVLPFANMSGDAANEYFSDGISEELRCALARIAGLRVTGRASVIAIKGRNEDVREIGQRLGVGAILEGSVRKSGDRVRITTQLVNVADGFDLWSETYDRTLDDIFAVQEEIARSVTGALKLVLSKDSPVSSVRPGNAEAYNVYLQARYFHRKASREGLEKAIGYYQQAITLDPEYALAWAGLADAHSWMADQGFMPSDQAYPKAQKALERAQALDSNQAEVHSVLGLVKMTYQMDWAGADAEMQRALALEPGNAEVMRHAARLAATLGRLDEAIDLGRRATEFDPLNVWCWIDVAYHSWQANQLPGVATAGRKALELDPETPGAHWLLALGDISQQRPEAALKEIELEPNEACRLHVQALGHQAAGREEEAEAALDELVQKYQKSFTYQIAEVYAFRGDVDRAFDWLERAYLTRDVGLQIVKNDPLLANLVADSRYPRFLQKLGLPY